ncbi:hypothetical protein BYT27DRAFT_7249806 [Phlegmacium glaucopus]|nr:hypothetical protein BYT27DRAFT_7249806 [Phlegmacium glaucopus]
MPTQPPLAQEPEEEEEEEDDNENEFSHQVGVTVGQVIAWLQHMVIIDKGKGTSSKSKAPKKKVETKTKEFSFTFEATQTNYLNFLSAVLDKHRYSKYTPITIHTRFNIRAIVPPNKAYVLKKDAIDINNFAEYESKVKKIIEEKPSKFSIFLSLNDVKLGAARRNGSESGDDGQSIHSEGDRNDTKCDDERAFARNRLILEKEYTNSTDSGYTYVGPNGEKTPLTPAMLSEWSQAMTKGSVSKYHPPNTATFDPQMRQRSLFQRPPSSTMTASPSETTPPLTQASELLRKVQKLFGPASVGSRHASSEPPTSPTSLRQVPASPPINTPSKLWRYLEPDILPLIGEQLLVDCGLTMGNAIHLKQGAASWWASPEAKRPKPLDYPLFVEGGCMSVFGSGLVPGKNLCAHEFTWHYYNQQKKCLIPVPDGFIPTLDPQYLDDIDMEEPPYKLLPANYQWPPADEDEMNEGRSDVDAEP